MLITSSKLDIFQDLERICVLISGNMYVFSLVVFDGTRSSNSSIQLLIVDENIPIASIDSSTLPQTALLGKVT